jgi:excisionase family DNA binding protein
LLTLAQVPEELNTGHSQIYAVVKRQDLRAIKMGGRGQWRIERSTLEAFMTTGCTEIESRTEENFDPIIGDDQN